MIPRYIYAKNFLGHEELEIALPPQGIFVLVGESGAGKSTAVVDCLGYALYGAVATRIRNGKQAGLRHRDHPGEAVTVRVMFEFDDGRRLVFARGIDARDAGWAEVWEPDPEAPDDADRAKLLSKGSTDVARFVARHVGADWQQFYASFVCRQDELTQLTSLRGAERKALVHQMLGMRELDRAVELATKEMRRQNNELSRLTGAVGERTMSGEEAKLAAARELATQAEQRATEARTAAERLRGELAAAQAKLEPLVARASAHAELERTQQELRLATVETEREREKLERHRSAEAELAARPEIEGQRAELDARRDEIAALYKRSRDYIALLPQRSAAAERLEQTRAQVLSALPVPAGAAAATAEAIESATELATQRARIEAEGKAAERELAERRRERDQLVETGECFTCLRPLGESHDHGQVLAALDTKLGELASQIEAAEAEAERLTALIPLVEQFEAAASEHAQLEQQLAALRDQGEVREQLGPLEEEGKQVSRQRDQCAARLAALSQHERELDPQVAGRLEVLEQKIAELEQKAAEARAQAGEALSNDELTSAQQERDRLQGELSRAEGALPELERATEREQAAVANAEQELEAFGVQLEAREARRQKVLDLQELQKYLSGFQRQLARDIRPALEEIGSQMLNQVSGGRHVAMHIDDDYEIEIERREGPTIRSRLLSGGEQIRANLCLRLALTRLVSQRTGVPLRMLVLDEPLPAQDPGHVERIMELLDSLRSAYPQQFIISHVGDLRNADETQYVIEFQTDAEPKVQLLYA